MNITPEIKDTRADGTPYRVSKVTFEASGYSEEILLASMADVLGRLTEFHVQPNTIKLKGQPKKRTRR